MNAQNANRDQSMLWGYSLEFWDWLGVRLMFVGAGVGVFALFVSLISAYLLYRVADAAQSELQSKTSSLDGEVARQKTRAAELEKEAANARLQTEQIKAVVAWRTIPPAAASELEKALATNPGSVNLRWTDGDPEALFFAFQFSQIFSKARWQVAAGTLKLSNALVFGIRLPDDAGSGQVLRAAFSTANIGFSTEPLPGGMTMEFMTSTIQGAPILVIGSRPPPQLP
jgi:hypothetical protein